MMALGMIEVYGYLAAVEALDAALKAANVKLVQVTKVSGGLVSVLVTGDVGATKAAIDSAAASAERVGKVVSVHVIPRPAKDIERMLGGSPERSDPTDNGGGSLYDAGHENAAKEPEVQTVETRTDDTDNMDADEGKTNSGETVSVDSGEFTPDKLKAMTVQDLRAAARNMEVTNMTRKDIRFAKKEELIKKISEFLGQER
jgi:Carbon dioxide concentrating mechanism/carboxysome shell protein